MYRIFTITLHRSGLGVGSTERSDLWPRAAVFDFDGLLVDTKDRWHRAYAEALTGTGRQLDPEAYTELAGASVGRAATQLRVPATALRTLLFTAFEDRPLVPLPGARKLISSLRGRTPLAVATNAPRELVTSTLDAIGLLDSFDLVVSAEAQRNEKPEPDVYRAVCDELEVNPSHAVAFEDSPIGVLAARRAGLTVIYVPSDGQPADADLEVGTLDDPRLVRFLGAARPPRS